MVSDAMLKFVFLPIRISRPFFPVKKGSLPLFFTVKQVFPKIKLWLTMLATQEKRKGSFQHEED